MFRPIHSSPHSQTITILVAMVIGRLFAAVMMPRFEAAVLAASAA